MISIYNTVIKKARRVNRCDILVKMFMDGGTGPDAFESTRQKKEGSKSDRKGCPRSRHSELAIGKDDQSNGLSDASGGDPGGANWV